MVLPEPIRFIGSYTALVSLVLAKVINVTLSCNRLIPTSAMFYFIRWKVTGIGKKRDTVHHVFQYICELLF